MLILILPRPFSVIIEYKDSSPFNNNLICPTPHSILLLPVILASTSIDPTPASKYKSFNTYEKISVAPTPPSISTLLNLESDILSRPAP